MQKRQLSYFQYKIHAHQYKIHAQCKSCLMKKCGRDIFKLWALGWTPRRTSFFFLISQGPCLNKRYIKNGLNGLFQINRSLPPPEVWFPDFLVWIKLSPGFRGFFENKNLCFHSDFQMIKSTQEWKKKSRLFRDQNVSSVWISVKKKILI